MEFRSIYYKERLRIINNKGTIGIVTLWSKTEYIESILRENGIDLYSDTSRICVIGNLYGNGLPHLIRNLLYNPQIDTLLLLGRDSTGSGEALITWMRDGVEEFNFLGTPKYRIKGREQIIDNEVIPDDFQRKPQIVRLGNPTDKNDVEWKKRLTAFFENYKPNGSSGLERVERSVPEAVVVTFPSNAKNHNVVEETPLRAWRELVLRLLRFGHLTRLTKGKVRKELHNVRVLITRPENEPREEIEKYNINYDYLMDYQAKHISSNIDYKCDSPYTYGNRITEHFGYDQLQFCIERLRSEPQNRHCFISLYDPRIKSDDVCLLSIYFRFFEERLCLTALYRTHNVMDAWMKNIYGLIKVLDVACEQTKLQKGSITVISQSISIDPDKIDTAEAIACGWKYTLKYDPNGQMHVFLDKERKTIIVEQYYMGTMVSRYEGKTARGIRKQIIDNMAVSDLSHAMYLGEELQKAEYCLENNIEYIQH